MSGARFTLAMRNPAGELLVGRECGDPATLAAVAVRMAPALGDHTWQITDDAGGLVEAGPGVAWRTDLKVGGRVMYQERDFERALVAEGTIVEVGGWRTGSPLPVIELALDRVVIDGQPLTLGHALRAFPPVTVSADPAAPICVVAIDEEGRP